MGLFDWLFGSKPKTPPWAQSLLNSPMPQPYMDYLRTGMIPEQNSSSGSSSSSLTNSSSNTRGQSQTTSAPFITNEWLGMINPVRSIVYNRLQDGSLPQAYRAEGLRNIGQAGSASRASMAQNLLSRGLFGREAGSEAALASDQAGQQASFLNSLPLLQRQLQDQDLQMATNLTSLFGRGMRTDQRSQSQTNSRSQTDSSSAGWSNTPSQFDIQGWGNMYNQAWQLANAPRSGGVLPDLLRILLGQWGGGSGRSSGGSSGGSSTTSGSGHPGYGG